MDALTRDYHAMGYQLAVHAIGDAAIEQTLNGDGAGAARASRSAAAATASSIAASTRPSRSRAWCRLGVEPVPQPVFIYDFGDLYLSVLEPERVHASYPMRDWINAGMKPAASSDAPVCDANIWPNIYTHADPQDLARHGDRRPTRP